MNVPTKNTLKETGERFLKYAAFAARNVAPYIVGQVSFETPWDAWKDFLKEKYAVDTASPQPGEISDSIQTVIERDDKIVDNILYSFKDKWDQQEGYERGAVDLQQDTLNRHVLKGNRDAMSKLIKTNLDQFEELKEN